MPSAQWQTDPSAAIAAFEKRHPDPEAGALLLWAFSSVDALHYLVDLDAEYETSRSVPGGHSPDVVDIAHARWATGTCITALDLCTAGLARALGRHQGPRELDLGDFARVRPSEAMAVVIRVMPRPALDWIQAVLGDAVYAEMKAARDALTHRRVPRHLYASLGSAAPDPRLDLQVDTHRIPVPRLIQDARALATGHLDNLLTLLPAL